MTKGRGQAIGFMLPWAIGFVVMIAVPMFASLLISFTDAEGALSVGDLSWVGAKHYREAVGWSQASLPTDGDPLFYKSLQNSLVYTLLAVPLGLTLSLAVALLLHQPFRGMSIVRGLVYLPHLMGGVATVIIWSWLLNPQFGWINEGIRTFYALLDPVVRVFNDVGTRDWQVPGWLYSPVWCKPALALMSAWAMGGAMLIFLAALRGIPESSYDAARLDGAGVCKRFGHVTWPQITPAVLFNLLVSSVFCMQSFTESYLLGNRSQEDGLLFYVVYVYESAFQPPYRLGYACALAWIFVVLLILIGAPLLWTSRWWVHRTRWTEGVAR